MRHCRVSVLVGLLDRASPCNPFVQSTAVSLSGVHVWVPKTVEFAQIRRVEAGNAEEVRFSVGLVGTLVAMQLLT